LTFPKTKIETIKYNLGMLTNIKMIRMLIQDNNPPKYEINSLSKYSCRINCIKCGITLDFSEKGSEINSSITDLIAGFTSLNFNLKIDGVCTDCQNRKVI